MIPASLAPNDIPPNRRILVVDDDQGILDTYTDILAPRPQRFARLKSLMDVAESQTAKFELSIASQGAAAIELVRARSGQNLPYGTAFVDMRMPPGMDGLATARAMRAIDARIFIVIVTAYSDHSLDEINRQLGHDVLLLRKPFTDDELLQIASTLIAIWNREQKPARRVDQMDGRVEPAGEVIGNKPHTHAFRDAMLTYLHRAVDVREWHRKSLDECLADYETFIIHTALVNCNDNPAEAARLLGIPPNALHYKLKRHGVAAHQDRKIVTLHGIKGGLARSRRGKTLERLVQDFEKAIIQETLAAVKYNHLRAALMLETSLVTLLTKMKQYGLLTPH